MKQSVLITSILLSVVKSSLAAGLVGTTLGPIPGSGGSSSTVTNFDTLTVTNTLYLGDANGQTTPEIRIPDYGILYFYSASGSELMRLDAGNYGDLHIYHDVFASSGYFSGSVAVANTMSLGNNNTTLTAANYGSLSVGSGVASGAYSVAIGAAVVSGGNYNFASGESTTVDGIYTFATGYGNSAGGSSTFVTGYQNSSVDGFANFISGYQNTTTGYLEKCTVMGSQAHALHDATFLWSDGSGISSSRDHEFTVYASGSIRLLGSPVKLDVGIASLATNAVNGAASGWTNSTGVDTTVAVSGVAVGFTLYNNAGTPIYTNAAGSTTFYPRVQAAGKIIVTAGTAVTLRSLGY